MQENVNLEIGAALPETQDFSFWKPRGALWEPRARFPLDLSDPWRCSARRPHQRRCFVFFYAFRLVVFYVIRFNYF